MFPATYHPFLHPKNSQMKLNVFFNVIIVHIIIYYLTKMISNYNYCFNPIWTNEFRLYVANIYMKPKLIAKNVCYLCYLQTDLF